MDDKLVPVDLRRAALRAFIRTGAQALSSAIPMSGISIYLTRDWLEGVMLGILGALLSALLAASFAYLDIISKGIPKDYVQAGREEDEGATIQAKPMNFSLDDGYEPKHKAGGDSVNPDA